MPSVGSVRVLTCKRWPCWPCSGERSGRVGRVAPSLVAHVPVWVHDDPEEARQAVAHQFRRLARAPFYVNTFYNSGFPEVSEGAWRGNGGRRGGAGEAYIIPGSVSDRWMVKSMEQELEPEFNVDFRLTGILLELDTLGTQLDLIEEQMDRSRKAAKCKLESELRKIPLNEFEGDDWETWDLLYEDYDYHVDVALPRILRSPFLISLFTVYESAATEIADLIRKKQKQQCSLDDIDIRIRGFLKRAKEYYKRVLQFKLSTSNESWKRLVLLYGLRNAMAHANGRIDMVKAEKQKERILSQKGVEDRYGFIVVSGDFLKETFELVKYDLEDLVSRYKTWDTAHRSSQQGNED